jgi:hypothetical protein
MVDETKDKSKKEQMSFVMRLLIDNFNIHQNSLAVTIWLNLILKTYLIK